MTTTIQAAVIQHHCTEQKHENLKRTESLIQQTKAQGANLVLLPELHATPYFCQDMSLKNFELAENSHGETAQMLQEASEGIVLIGSIFEANQDLKIFHNTALVYDNGELVGTYRKTHIPDDPGFAEKYYFTPGESIEPIETSIGKLGVLVCWDQWFPEAARIMALKGAECLLYPTAIGWDPNDNIQAQQSQLLAWQTIQYSHSVANHLPVIAANRIGFEKGVSTKTNFWGNSFICQPFIQSVTKMGSNDEGFVIQELKQNRGEMNKIWPFFRDRRTSLYQDILKKY